MFRTFPSLAAFVGLQLLIPAVTAHGQDQESPRSATGLGTGSAYRDAELLFRDGNYPRALDVIDEAADDVLPVRIFNRFQALAARCCLQMNQRARALRRVELIWQREPVKRLVDSRRQTSCLADSSMYTCLLHMCAYRDYDKGGGGSLDLPGHGCS